MTPLEIKLSQALSDEIQRSRHRSPRASAVDEPVINTDQLAQVVTRTIKTEMSAALLVAAQRRATAQRVEEERRASAVNKAIDEVIA